MRDIRKFYTLEDRKHQQQTVMTDEKPNMSDLKMPCYMFLDQASHTGYSLFDDDSRLVLTGVIYREESRENFNTYIHEMVKEVEVICEEYGVTRLFYEEVYIPEQVSVSTAEKLHYIKHHVQDVGYHNPDIEVLGLDANRWKQELARPKAFKKSDNDKDQVMKFVEEVFPLVSFTTDDESDALGMGIAVMIKDKNKQNIYNVTRYNKKLPIHLEIMQADTPITDPEFTNKLKVRYSVPFRVGGLYELALNRSKAVEQEIRKYLSHKDSLLYVKIPREYKYWALMLLLNNVSVHDITREDKSYILVASRKKRL